MNDEFTKNLAVGFHQAVVVRLRGFVSDRHFFNYDFDTLFALKKQQCNMSIIKYFQHSVHIFLQIFTGFNCTDHLWRTINTFFQLAWPKKICWGLWSFNPKIDVAWKRKNNSKKLISNKSLKYGCSTSSICSSYHTWRTNSQFLEAGLE